MGSLLMEVEATAGQIEIVKIEPDMAPEDARGRRLRADPENFLRSVAAGIGPAGRPVQHGGAQSVQSAD